MSTPLNIPILAASNLPSWLAATRRPFHDDMYAMYSSEAGGIVTEPVLMSVPVDDHLVHRGDGVFETMKCLNGRIYCFREHLERLYRSAGHVALRPTHDIDTTGRIVLETVRASGRRDCLVRILLSRGPGSMGINPYDCPKTGLYILVHRIGPPFMAGHPGGAVVITSDLPVKAGAFATIKTCNYLPNAMLKKEAVDRGSDFALNFDEQNFLAEGATENAGVVTQDRMLIIPGRDRILSGTTMHRVFELAEKGEHEGWLRGRRVAGISRDDLKSAAEVLIFGTTTDVTAVVQLDGRPVGDGRPGPVFRELSRLLLAEQAGDNPFSVAAFA